MQFAYITTIIILDGLALYRMHLTVRTVSFLNFCFMHFIMMLALFFWVSLLMLCYYQITNIMMMKTTNERFSRAARNYEGGYIEDLEITKMDTKIDEFQKLE